LSHSDQFGDLRSLLQGQPNLERWSALCAHVYQHGHALDQAHWVYLREHLKRWPLELCAMPQDWIDELFDERGGPWLQICRQLCWDERDIEPDHVDELVYSPWLRHLESLSIARTRRPVWARFNLTDEGAVALTQSENFHELRRLSLCGHHLRPDSVQRIVTGDRFPWLEHLDLSFNQLAFLRATADAPWTLPLLKSLTLRDVELTFAGLEQLSRQSERLPALEALDLSAHAFDVEAITGPLRGFQWANLKALTLSGWALGDSGALTLLARLDPSLARLDLSYNGLSNVTLNALADGHVALRRLDLSGNALGGANLAALLSKLNHLEQLSCSNCLLDAAQASQLWLSPTLMGLKRLDISSQPIQTSELEALLNEVERPELVELKLSRMGLTDDGARALSRAPALSRLEVLDISQNMISAQGLELLLGSEHLRGLTRLIADGNPLEMTQAQELISRHARLHYNLQDARYALPDLGDEPWDEDHAWE